MGKILQIAVAVIFITMVSACANSGGDKWAKDEASTKEASSSSSTNWQKEQESDDSTKKASSSYWSDQNRY